MAYRSVSIAQLALCQQYGVVPEPTLPTGTAGVADSVMPGDTPLNDCVLHRRIAPCTDLRKQCAQTKVSVVVGSFVAC
jgi:hypothetical protein